jgi:hypothetical protein
MAITGGKKFQAALNRLGRVARDFDHKVAKVGWFPDAKYPENGTQVAYVAAIQEYGSPTNNIPPRPFIRPAISQSQGDWARIIADGSRLVVRGQQSVDGVLGLAGAQAQADIQAQIEATSSPPLKASTLRARMYRRRLKNISEAPNTPLRDTGHMIASVTHVVEKG